MKSAVLICLMACLIATGCAGPQPMTRERAARLCQSEARQADGVSGDFSLGTGTTGSRAGASITLNSNLFNPRSEAEVLAECIDRRMAGRDAPPAPSGITLSFGGGI
jgi:hypothetical protein